MKKQYKLIFAILFGFNILLTIVGVVIGASFPTIALSISTSVWIAMYYKSLKDYSELHDKFICTLEIHTLSEARHYKALDIIKEGLTREWASPEEFEKWKDEKMNELFSSEE